MQLPDGLRQIVAGGCATAGFLALYLAAGLAWWLALLLGAVTYLAFLVLIRRRPAATERFVSEGVSAADIDTAIAALGAASTRMARAASRSSEADARVFRAMAGHLERLRDNHRADPRDFQYTRRFINTDLPRMLETAESYVELAQRSKGLNQARLAPVAGRVHGFLPVLERIEAACLDNDFRELEVQIGVLSDKLDRRYGASE